MTVTTPYGFWNSHLDLIIFLFEIGRDTSELTGDGPALGVPGWAVS